jgi:hypothetical protein
VALKIHNAELQVEYNFTTTDNEMLEMITTYSGPDRGHYWIFEWTLYCIKYIHAMAKIAVYDIINDKNCQKEEKNGKLWDRCFLLFSVQALKIHNAELQVEYNFITTDNRLLCFPEKWCAFLCTTVYNAILFTNMIYFILHWVIERKSLNFSVLISSCNFDVEKNSLCVYVRYEYTEWHHWSRAAPEL